MSDFALWLYANYICPQLDAIEKNNYESDFYLLERALSPASQIHMDRVLAFTAIQAFLLGFRTSEGLTDLPPSAHGTLIKAQRSGSGGERRGKEANAVPAAGRGRS